MPLQAELAVGAVDDPLEHEADRIAEAAMRTPQGLGQPGVAPTASGLSRAGRNVSGGGGAAPSSVHAALRSPGAPLSAEVRAFMEPRFGCDFSRVRVRADPAGERSARDVGANAYTVGHDIVFAQGRFAPATSAGRRLLAHELAHVVQQTGLGNGAPQAAVVQRDAAIGLRKADEVADFVKFARDFVDANPNKTLEELGLFLMDKANAELIGNGDLAIRDPPSFAAMTHGTAGGFRHETWTVTLDLAGTAAHPLTTKLKDLTVDQIAEVAGVCYHETRHAEQAFLVARVVASEAKGKKDAKAIATELAIPEFVAKAALNSTEPLPGKAGLAQIAQWRAFGDSGRHHDFWDWNETFRGFVQNVLAKLPSPSPEGVDAIVAAWTPLVPTIANWRTASLPPLEAKIAALTKAKASDPTDAQVLRDAKAIRAGIRKVIDADKALHDQVTQFDARKAAAARRPITVSEAHVIQSQFALLWIDLELALRELEQTSNNAYRAYPLEADAYAVEDAVIKGFKARPKTAAPPKK